MTRFEVTKSPVGNLVITTKGLRVVIYLYPDGNGHLMIQRDIREHVSHHWFFSPDWTSASRNHETINNAYSSLIKQWWAPRTYKERIPSS